MLKAYFDDSNMGQGSVAVLAGWMAPAKTWVPFAADWDAVLCMRPRIGYFKCHEWRTGTGELGGISVPRAAEKLNLLIEVLVQHNPLGLACVISNDLHRQYLETTQTALFEVHIFSRSIPL